MPEGLGNESELGDVVYVGIGNADKTKERPVGSEVISELNVPVVVLVQEQNPRLFTELGSEEGISLNTLPSDITYDVLSDLSRVYLEPYILVPPKADHEKIDTYLTSGNVEAAGQFGPFAAYRFVKKGEVGNQRLMVFGNRKSASQAVARIMPPDLHCIQPEIDKKPKVPERTERYFKGVSGEERKEMRKKLADLLDEHFVKRLKETDDIAKYPENMRDGMDAVLEVLQTRVAKDGEGRVKTDSKDNNWQLWHFGQQYILPLREYLDYRMNMAEAVQRSELTEDIGQVLFDYDAVIETMRAQAELVIGQQQRPHHNGFLIPTRELNGLQFGEVQLHFTDTHLVIIRGKDQWMYPLPERTPDGEVSIKGGIARLVTKIALGVPIDDELPPSDLDIVTFGTGKALSKERLAEKYGVSPEDIDRISSGDIHQYLGDKDQAVNEVLLTPKGIVVSFNALSVYFQRTTEASADPVHNIHGSHVLHVHRGYFAEGADVADYYLVNGTRFPSSRALSRMYKLLIEGKVDSITVPRGSLKRDLDPLQWLVLARKILNVSDPVQRDNLLGRMVELANVVNSRFYKAEYTDNKSGPLRFIDAVAKKFEAESHRKFDISGKMSDKETLDWIATRLVRQILTRCDRFFGFSRERKFEKRLTAADMLPIQIVLPKKEHFDKEYWEREITIRPRRETVVDTESFNWRDVDIDAILANPKYALLGNRNEERRRQLLAIDDSPREQRRDLWQRLTTEEQADEDANLASGRERREYLHYYLKYRALNELQGINSLDPGLYQILHRFNRLPFSSHQSCTGHIISGTDRLEQDWLPALVFMPYLEVSPQEQEVQREFLRGIRDLDLAICTRLGIKPYNILDLRGEALEFADGQTKELSVAETLEKGMDLYIFLNVPDPTLRTSARRILTTVWEEFYRYVNSFFGEEGQTLELRGGDVFVRQRLAAPSSDMLE